MGPILEFHQSCFPKSAHRWKHLCTGPQFSPLLYDWAILQILDSSLGHPDTQQIVNEKTTFEYSSLAIFTHCTMYSTVPVYAIYYLVSSLLEGTQKTTKRNKKICSLFLSFYLFLSYYFCFLIPYISLALSMYVSHRMRGVESNHVPSKG